MPASTALSIDEFAALVAATLNLSDLDVCGQACAGDAIHINSVDGQEQPQTPPPTSISVKRPPLLSWHRKKPTFESWPTSTARFGGSTTDSFPDSPHHSKEYGDTGITTTFGNYFNILSRKSRATRMTACEPTIIAASMSTVDFGNCLSLGGGGCSSGSYGGTSSGSRNSTHPVYNRNTGGTVSTAYTNANTTPTIPVFTLEVNEDASLRRSSDVPIDLEPTVMGLSSTLRLPRSPTPLFRKSVPDLRIKDLPRNHWQQQPESPRTPRKSFFSKLKKQLSSKTATASDSHSPITLTPPLPTTPVPDLGAAHSDGSPTGLFKLHLSLPLAPLSLSTPASPNPSRSPSPRFPFRAISTSYKRESAPPAILEKPPSPYSRNLSPVDPPQFRSGDERKRRIYSLPDYNYSHAHPDEDPSPLGPIAKQSQEQSLEHGEQPTQSNRRNRSNSILSLSDCLVGSSGKVGPQMNWMVEEPKKCKSKKANGSIKEHRGRSSQPFPSFSQPESDDVLSEPSKYSCESAPRSVRMSLGTRNGTINENDDAISNPNVVAFPVGLESEPGSTSLVQPPLPVSLPRDDHGPEEELPSYAPFVPLVFQHERLQQKLQKSVPLTSMPAEEVEKVACIKSVTLKPFPPRTTSLSAPIQVRQRTKSAPNAAHEKLKSKYHPATPPIPALLPHLTSEPTTARNQPGTSMPPSKKDRKVKRPTTAPANSTPNLTFPFKEGVIPFPVVKEPIEEEGVDPDRQRKFSKLKRLKPRKSLVSQSQSSASTRPAESPSPLQSTGKTNEHSNPHRKGDSGSRTESVGLNYNLSLSKHPYAQTRPSEGMSPTSKETDAKVETSRTSKASVTFVPSTTDGESRRLQSQSKTERRFKVAQSLMPLSPTSPTSNSGSGSGSDVSTKSPVTPRSPLFWNVSGAGIAAAVKSRIGLGIPGSTPTSGSEEGHISAERKAHRDSAINSDSISACVNGTRDDASRIKKEYTPPHPYSRSYLTTGLQDAPLTEENSQTIVDQLLQLSAIDDEPSSIKHRPSTQTILHHGVAPSKPPPVGPLPFLPGAVRGKSARESYQLGDNLSGEVPPSPVPSEYTRAFSNPTRTGNDDDDDDDSHPFTAPSYAPSQSSESYGHDPEYEALLAANTRANVGELASMRNIGVGRRLMSGYPQPPSSRIDPTSSSNEGKRKRVHSEVTRHSGMGGEWTLFLGNDDTPPRREDIIADLNSVSMTGIKSLSGVRARTKSESALKSLGLGHKRPFVMKRAKSSNLVPGSSSTPLSSLPPVPRLVKQQILKSDDWTLSLPLLPPVEKDPGDTEADLSRSNSNSVPLIRGAKPPAQYLERECVVMDDEFDLDDGDDGDDMTIAESQVVVDAPFVLDIDSLDLEDDDSLLDYSINSTSDRAPNLDHLLFSVPRVVSKGSGMESAKWGEEVDEDIIKKKGRRLSDGLDSLEGMAGVSVRVDVNEDGESVCIVDGLSLNTEEVGNGSEEGCGMEGHEFVDPDASDATKENLARLDALSADLKRFNELLKEGISTTTAVGLKHVKSCGQLPSQTEVKSDHLKVKQSLDTLRDPESTKTTLGVSVKDRVKSWSERSVTLSVPPVPVSSSQSSPPTPSMALKSRPPLPFAPSSSPPSYSRPLGRSAALGIGPAPGRSATGRAMTIATQTKPSHLKVVPIAAAIPDGVVGSGLKVGGNGRVISLSCSSAAAPVVASTHAGLLRVITNETKDKKASATFQQSKDDEESEGNGNDSILEKDTKRNSASSFTSTDSFFTSFSSSSQAQTPPTNKYTSSGSREDSAPSDCRSSSSSPTPTATSPPGLRIITSSTTTSTRVHSPVDDVHTPSSSALPTPLASSFPTVPPLPAALSSLGEDLKTVSRMLAGAWMSKNKTTMKADEQESRRRHATECMGSRLSSASDVSVRTIVPEQQPSQGSSDAPLHSTSEGERDTESTYSDSFYSARSSFEA